MKQDRNCMYPTYGMPMGPMMNMPFYNDDYSNLTNQIKELERRISNLESMIGNNFNNTYQMM